MFYSLGVYYVLVTGWKGSAWDLIDRSPARNPDAKCNCNEVEPELATALEICGFEAKDLMHGVGIAHAVL
ncbi:hypothetical protein PC116_g7724 [Phytophthora cactorum]|nr:hypothetical protein PC114_g4878 [Phytophthora cactorum]KAG3186951.1 hypothetical protein C6341_g3574 [Phytophthora cactorum]KAG4244472.1 hypothetical protein PC116_g7724 [Phytophthora cactorum]